MSIHPGLDELTVSKLDGERNALPPLPTRNTWPDGATAAPYRCGDAPGAAIGVHVELELVRRSTTPLSPTAMAPPAGRIWTSFRIAPDGTPEVSLPHEPNVSRCQSDGSPLSCGLPTAQPSPLDFTAMPKSHVSPNVHRSVVKLVTPPETSMRCTPTSPTTQPSVELWRNESLSRHICPPASGFVSCAIVVPPSVDVF